MQEITTIRTGKGHFEVFKDEGKFFLKYLEKGKQQPEKVGYMIKKADGFWLQEAFFDKCNYPICSFDPVLNANEPTIKNDLMDNLVAACYRVEKHINRRKRGEHKIHLTGYQKSLWTRIIGSLQSGVDIDKVDLENSK